MFSHVLNIIYLVCLFLLVCFQVVVLSSKPVPFMPQRSVGEVSFIMNSTESKALRSSRTSSLMGFESSLEDVQVGRRDHFLTAVYEVFHVVYIFNWLDLLSPKSPLNVFIQEDEGDECEEEESMMMDTTDQTEAEEDGEDKILVCKKTHQVSTFLFHQWSGSIRCPRGVAVLCGWSQTGGREYHLPSLWKNPGGSNVEPWG